MKTPQLSGQPVPLLRHSKKVVFLRLKGIPCITVRAHSFLLVQQTAPKRVVAHPLCSLPLGYVYTLRFLEPALPEAT